MKMYEEFEKWWLANGIQDNYKIKRWCEQIWELRQTEIDALVHDNNNMRKAIVEYDKENAALRAAIPDGDDRVYACLTACVGIPTETLEDLPGTFAEILTRAEEREERLRKAAEEVLKAFDELEKLK